MRIALVLLALLTFPAAANAASVAYIDNGEVWLSSLDGAQKVRLASHGGQRRRRDREVARGRAVGLRPDRRGPQQAGQDVAVLVVQGLGAEWDLDGRGTAQRAERLDDATCIRSASTSRPTASTWSTATRTPAAAARSQLRARLLCPPGDQQLARADRSSPATRHPTLFGSRVIAHSRLGRRASRTRRRRTRATSSAWLTTSRGGGLTVRPHRRRRQRAAGRAASSRMTGEPTAQDRCCSRPPTASAAIWATRPRSIASCPRPAVADDVSLSQDARFVAWSDDQGLKVAGTPVTDAAIRAR